MTILSLVAALVLSTAQIPSVPGGPAPEDTSKWRQTREAGLKADQGWLSVSGLRWLKEGETEDGMVVLDFNCAYSPPCAFTDYATCPLPPPQNRLTVAVEAGEKDPHKGR